MEAKLDCGDNSCEFAENKTGMRTNGGCRCLKDLDFSRRMAVRRYLVALREENALLKAVYQDACNAIATLTREREDARAEVAACDGHAYLRDEIKRLEGLILKVWEQSESDDDALRQLGPEACRIRGEAK